MSSDVTKWENLGRNVWYAYACCDIRVGNEWNAFGWVGGWVGGWLCDPKRYYCVSQTRE